MFFLFLTDVLIAVILLYVGALHPPPLLVGPHAPEGADVPPGSPLVEDLVA